MTLIAWLDLLTVSKDVKAGAREVRIVIAHAKIGNTFHIWKMGKKVKPFFLEAPKGRSTMDEGFINVNIHHLYNIHNFNKLHSTMCCKC